MSVFVLDRRGKALMPCSEKRARKLLDSGRACVVKLIPFVIRLKDRVVEDSNFQNITLKLDPGSKKTGIALVRDTLTISPETGEIQKGASVLTLAEIVHRGQQISKNLTARSQYRRRRRGNLRYRSPRFLNRTKPKGWLAPSLQHRVDTTLSWVNRYRKWVPITSISMELVKFDMQKIENPNISGIEYQQGTLFGYEVKEYLLEKFNRTCVYCDVKDVPLNIEHLVPRSKGGSNRISNLAISCVPCNQQKKSQSLENFLVNDTKRLTKIKAQIKKPLRDAAAVNSTSKALVNALIHTGLPVETASGGRTKYNRTRLGVPKTHALDAVCVGEIGSVEKWSMPTLVIKCTGRGSYKRTRTDQYGFPRGYLLKDKSVQGFQTGDMIKAHVTKGKKVGVYIGRVAVRASGSFNIQTSTGLIQGISHRYCHMIQRADGYGYFINQDSILKEENQGRVKHDVLSLPALRGEVSRIA